MENDIENDIIEYLYEVYHGINRLDNYDSSKMTEIIETVKRDILNNQKGISIHRDYQEFYNGYYMLFDKLRIKQRSPRELKVLQYFNRDLSQIIMKYDFYLEGKQDFVLRNINTAVYCIENLSNFRIVTGYSNNKLKIWNTQTGKCEKTLEGHTGPVDCLVVINDKIISGSWDHTLRIWNTENYESSLIGHTGSVGLIKVLSPNKIVSASADTTMRIWNLNSGKTEHILKGHWRDITAIDILPNGKIISTSEDSTIKMWDPNTGQLELSLDEKSGINCMAIYSPGYVIVGTNYFAVNIWNLINQEKEIIFDEHNGIAMCLNILPDKRIVSGSADSTIKIWNTQTERSDRTIRSHTGTVNHILILSDERIMSTSYDGSIRIFRNLIEELVLIGSTARINCANILPDQRIAVGDIWGNIKIWK